MKRKIIIMIELNEEDSENYSDVCSELVIEDFIKTNASIEIISDNVNIKE